MSFPSDNPIYNELIYLFGKENITLTKRNEKDSVNQQSYPIKNDGEIIGDIQINSKLKLDDYHYKLIDLLIEKHQQMNANVVTDHEELLWREAIVEDNASWRDKWIALNSTIARNYVNVYFQLPFVNIEDNDLSISVKELLLAATESKSYFLPLEKGLYVWIISSDSEDKNDIIKIVEDVLHTITAELLLDLQVFLGELYEMPMQLREHVREECDYFLLAQKFSMKRKIITFNDIIPFMFINSVNKEEIERTIEKLLGNVKEDVELLHTLKVYMSENLNVSEAAKKLYIHRNSLQYRLDKFSEKTGIDIRNFENAVNVYIAILALGKFNNN